LRERKQAKVSKPRIVLDGRVYLIRLWIDDRSVYKVGVTAGTVARRVLGIIESVWQGYGYFPRAEIVGEWRTRNHYDVEGSVHQVLREKGYGYRSRNDFSGSGELFDGIALDILVALIKESVDRDDEVSEDSIDRLSVAMD